MLEARRKEGDNLTVQATLPGVVLEVVASRTTLVVPGAMKEAFTVVVVPGAMKEALMVVVVPEAMKEALMVVVVPEAMKEAFMVVVVPEAMKEALMVVVVPDVPHPHTKAEQPSRCPEYVDKKDFK